MKKTYLMSGVGFGVAAGMAASRIETEHYGWATMWMVIALGHVWAIYDCRTRK